MFKPWERALLEAQPVARLATVSAGGQPSVLPVVFALDGDTIVMPLDGKPKRVPATQLRRVRDLLANPQVALVVDHYADDWAELAWVQVRGTAALLEQGPGYERGLALLRSRYPQYRQVALGEQALIVLNPAEVRSWRMQPETSLQ
jgi:PPOX class probable F420-dependent enzyme